MCGIFGIYGSPQASILTQLGLQAQQHRGQESAGIGASDYEKVRSHKALGLVADVFYDKAILQNKLPGEIAIGHNRYSTKGSTNVWNAQPFTSIIKTNDYDGIIAIALNGNLTNAEHLKNQLSAKGAIFQTTTDTELIAHLIAHSMKSTMAERIVDALGNIQGAYSLLILTSKHLYAARDPHGFRPLALGKLNDSPVLASETCAFNLIRAKYQREIQPGEVIEIYQGKIKQLHQFEQKMLCPCIFEYIYFARPDSIIFGREVMQVRLEFGREVARQCPVANAELVVGVPDSGFPAAFGHSEESGIQLAPGILRGHYAGRTFIEPDQAIRLFDIGVKLFPVIMIIDGKIIIIIEDSIVRGNTATKLISLIREVSALLGKPGPKEIHLLSSCSAIPFSCFYGIDTPEQDKLIASQFLTQKGTVDRRKLKKHLGVDSVGFPTIEGMCQAVNRVPAAIDGHSVPTTFCTACFTGDYPAGIGGTNKMSLEKT